MKKILIIIIFLFFSRNNAFACESIAAPANLSPLNEISSGMHNLTWNPVPGAVKYYIRLDDENTPWSGTCDWTHPGDICDNSNNTTTNSYSYNFQNGHAYHWWVHAVNACGQLSNPTGSPQIIVKDSNINDIAPLYKIRVGQKLELNTACPLSPQEIWTYTPDFYDGGTIKNMTFSCALPGSNTNITKSTKIIIFRDFSQLIKSANSPITPARTTWWNSMGQDTLYLRPNQKIGDYYYAFSSTDSSNNGQWNQLPVFKSTDLINWTPTENNPAISQSRGQWDDLYILHPATIKIGNLWHMYYSAYAPSSTSWSGNPPSPGGYYAPEQIGLATSNDFIHWQKYANNPIITAHAALPTVIQIGDLYYIYYYDRYNNQLKYSTSNDGLHWTYQDIALKKQDVDWDNSFSMSGFDPSVIKNSKGFYELTYSVLRLTNEFPEGWTQDIGYAVSEDGKNWYKFNGAILKGSKISGAFDEWFVANPILYFNDNDVYLYYAGAKRDPAISNGLAQGGLAILKGPSKTVNMDDYNLLINKGNINIFDYNRLISNFGR